MLSHGVHNSNDVLLWRFLLFIVLVCRHIFAPDEPIREYSEYSFKLYGARKRTGTTHLYSGHWNSTLGRAMQRLDFMLESATPNTVGENNDVYSFLSFKKQKNGAKIDWRREHKILVQHEKCRMWERNGTLLGDVKCWQHSCMTKVLPKIYAIFRSPAESISFYIVFTDAIVWQAQTHIFSRSHSIYIAF